MDIALGKKPIDFLSGFCDAKLKDVREVTQPFLRQHVEFDFIQIVLDDLLKGFSDLQFVSTNILLHTIIEGVARAFCLQVYLHQHPDMNVKEAESILNNWPSLESLIVRQPWERDISITLIQAIILNEYINEPELNDATLFFNDQKLKQKQLNLFFEKLKKRIEDNPDIGKEELEQIGRELKDDMPCTPDQVFDIREERINVSLKVELQFLVRRHKDNRNKIIHGHFADFNTKWHCYLNLQALYRLGNVIRNYYEAMA